MLEDRPSKYHKLVVSPVRHWSSTPHAPPAQRRIPEYGADCPCCALISLRWTVSTRWWLLLPGMCVRCEAQACSVLEWPVYVPLSSFQRLYPLDNIYPIEKAIGPTIRRQLWRSIPIVGHNSSASGSIDVSNNRVRAVTTIAYCATDMLAKVYIDRYLGHQHYLKTSPDRLPFEQLLRLLVGY